MRWTLILLLLTGCAVLQKKPAMAPAPLPPMPPVTLEAPAAPFVAPAKQYYLIWTYPPYGTNIQFEVWQNNLAGWYLEGVTTNKQYPISPTRNLGLFRVRAHDLRSGLFSDWNQK